MGFLLTLSIVGNVFLFLLLGGEREARCRWRDSYDQLSDRESDLKERLENVEAHRDELQKAIDAVGKHCSLNGQAKHVPYVPSNN